MSDLILANIPKNAEHLAQAKGVIEELIKIDEEAKDKSPEELDEMIRQAYWELRLTEARLRRLGTIRETARPLRHENTGVSKPDGGVGAN